MSTDSTIKFVTDRSVLGYGPGETIQLTEAEFERLGEAFFAQVEAKFVLDPTDGAHAGRLPVFAPGVR